MKTESRALEPHEHDYLAGHRFVAWYVAESDEDHGQPWATHVAYGPTAGIAEERLHEAR